MTLGAWEQQLKVGIGIAMGHSGPPLNAKHLFEMQMPKPHGIVFNQAYGVDMARNNIVVDAMNHGATHIVWLDEDVFPPFDGVMRLLRHHDRKAIVSGVYYDKKKGIKQPAAWIRDEKGEYNFVIDPEIYEDAKAEDGTVKVQIAEVDSVGFGFCMTPVKLFEELERPWFWYELAREAHRPKEEGEELRTSEDFFLCRNAKKIGYKVMVDLSIRCDHLTWAFISGKDGSMEIARI